MSGKMPTATSDTGFAEGRAGGHGRLYDQTDDLAGQKGNEGQKKTGEAKGSFNEINLIMYVTSVIIIIGLGCYLFWAGAWGEHLG